MQTSWYEDSVPRYHAVRIRKEERQIKDGKTSGSQALGCLLPLPAGQESEPVPAATGTRLPSHAAPEPFHASSLLEILLNSARQVFE
uniref:Uncharacterized protein n=1 Tax=Junco hyemalis TaxID=40217 RepID=A0A8C5JEI2_JUNHY